MEVILTGAVTVSKALAVWALRVARIVVVPAVKPVAVPLGSTVATVVALDVHVTVLVIGALVPSEYSPVATKACVLPVRILAFDGVMLIEVNIAGVTVTVVLALFPLKTPVMTVLPAATAVTKPLLAFIVATPGEAEVKLLLFVTLSDDPSE